MPGAYTKRNEQSINRWLSPIFSNNFGSAAAEAGALEAARGHFERSVALDPSYDIGLKNLARVCIALNDFSAARNTVAKLDAIKKLDPEMVLIDAQCQRRTGDLAGARDKLEQLAYLMPKDARVFRELGLLYTDDLKDPVMGRRFLSRAVGLDPGQVDLLGKINANGSQPFPSVSIPQVRSPVQMPNINVQAPQSDLVPSANPGVGGAGAQEEPKSVRRHF